MKETKEMMEIIHNNRKKVYEENIKANTKKESHKKNIKAIVIAFITLTLLGIGLYAFNENQVKGCIENGHSENFCRFAGE